MAPLPAAVMRLMDERTELQRLMQRESNPVHEARFQSLQKEIIYALTYETKYESREAELAKENAAHEQKLQAKQLSMNAMQEAAEEEHRAQQTEPTWSDASLCEYETRKLALEKSVAEREHEIELELEACDHVDQLQLEDQLSLEDKLLREGTKAYMRNDQKINEELMYQRYRLQCVAMVAERIVELATLTPEQKAEMDNLLSVIHLATEGFGPIHGVEEREVSGGPQTSSVVARLQNCLKAVDAAPSHSSASGHCKGQTPRDCEDARRQPRKSTGGPEEEPEPTPPVQGASYLQRLQNVANDLIDVW